MSSDSECDDEVWEPKHADELREQLKKYNDPFSERKRQAAEERRKKRDEALIKEMYKRKRVNNHATKEHVQTQPDLDAEIAHLWREIARLSRENNIQAEQLRNLSKK